MRTTLNIDDDVLDQARLLAEKTEAPFRQVVNEALRLGLAEVAKSAATRPYRTESRPMGLKAGRNIDNIQELIAQVEGEDHR